MTESNESVITLQELTIKGYSNEFFNLQEELFLGRLLKASRSDDATPEELADGRKAANLLAYANRKLVFKMAHRMYKDCPVGVDEEDFISEGMAGMARALQTYDPDRGFKFSTYATKWIFHYIQRHGHDISKVAKFPRSKVEKLISINHKLAAAKNKGITITPEVMNGILISEKIDEAEYNKMMMFNSMSFSLEGPAFNDDGSNSSLLEIINPTDDAITTFGNQGDLDPSHIIEGNAVSKAIAEAMIDLTDDEKKILGLVYGPGRMTEKGEKRITNAEAREIMDMDRKTFNRTLTSAHKKMKKKLIDNGIGPNK